MGAKKVKVLSSFTHSYVAHTHMTFIRSQSIKEERVLFHNGVVELKNYNNNNIYIYINILR